MLESFFYGVGSTAFSWLESDIANGKDMQELNQFEAAQPIRVVLGYAVLLGQHMEIEESLNILNVELNRLLADAPWYGKRGLSSLTIAFSIVDKEGTLFLGKNYIGSDKRNPRIIVQIDGNIVRRARGVHALYAYFLSGCARGLEYAVTRYKLPSAPLGGLENLKNDARYAVARSGVT